MALDLKTLYFYAKRHISDEQLFRLAKSNMPLTGPNGVRRWVAARDFEAFLKLYFPDEFVWDFGDIHYQFIQDIQGIRNRRIAKQAGIKLARAIPRGHAKSTYFSRMLPIWAFLYGWSPLTVLIGNNSTAAGRLVKNIKENCETNEALQEDFPGLGTTGVWGEERIEYLSSSIVCFGVGSGAIRGVSKPSARPSLVIGDDLDDDASVRSAVQLESNIEWFTKSVMGLGDQLFFTTSFIVVGTIIRKTSLMSHVLGLADFQSIVQRGVLRFANNGELWKQWGEWFIAQAMAGKPPETAEDDEFFQSRKDEMLAGAEILWPRPNGYYAMLKYRLANGDSAFASEIQNDPSSIAGKLGHLPKMSLPEDINDWQLLASLDPTIKGGIKNDKAAWIEAYFHMPTKRVLIALCDAEQRAFADTVDMVLERLRASVKPGQRRYDALYCESNSAGTLMADQIEERCAAEALFYNVQRVHNSENKEDRIATLGVYASRGQLFVLDTIDQEFLDEYEQWPGYKWDDAIDAASTILRELAKLGLIDLIPQDF